MKNFILAIGLLCSTALFAQSSSINWMSIEEAVEAQQTNPKKILMDVYTSWCGPCKMMMKNTFTDPNVIAYINKNYYAVKFDAESPDDITFQGRTFTNPTYDPKKQGRNGVHEFSRALQVSAYPTIVYMNEEAQVIAPVKGYQTPAQIELYLRFFNEGDYTSQDDWTTFSGNFKPTW